MRRSKFNFPGPRVMVFLLPLAGCDQKSAETPLPPSVPPVTASVPSPVPVALPPAVTDSPAERATALSSLLAPVALFPDTLLAQVLAASLHPDDVASASVWLLQNKALSGDALRRAVDARDWPPAVKALTGFPDVLAQMARNLSWTRSLGDAYHDSPETVMNEVQILRQRAANSGALSSSSRQTVARSLAPASGSGAGAAPAVTKASGTPSATPAPRQTITIQPASPDVVYVPVYGSAVYGNPPVAYPPGYSTGDMVATGLVSFTAGVVVGALAGSHNDWGWGQWGMRWGPSPVVVYRHRTFVDRTVIRHDDIYRPRPYLAPGPVRLPHFAPVREPGGPAHYAGGVAAPHPLTPPVVHHRAVGPLREPTGGLERQTVHLPEPVKEPGPVRSPFRTEKPLRYDPSLHTTPCCMVLQPQWRHGPARIRENG